MLDVHENRPNPFDWSMNGGAGFWGKGASRFWDFHKSALPLLLYFWYPKRATHTLPCFAASSTDTGSDTKEFLPSERRQKQFLLAF
jgi:hypothetical protein